MLEKQGYEVKSELRSCDVVAIKDESPTVIVELKLQFSLELLLQGSDRQNLTDDVYLAVLAPDTSRKRKNWRAKQKGYVKLCRKLGLGLMQVTPVSDGNFEGDVSVLLDPKPYAPRKSKSKSTRLMKEFIERVGDPNTGGTTKTKIMTAYRQNALKCAKLLFEEGEMKLATLREKSGVETAGSILQNNHYGWFERIERGVYGLTVIGRDYLKSNSEALKKL